MKEQDKISEDMLVLGPLAIPADVESKIAFKCIVSGCRMLKHVLGVLNALTLSDEEVIGEEDIDVYVTYADENVCTCNI